MITTLNKNAIDYLNPDPEQIDMHDIITILHKNQRFMGHRSYCLTGLQHVCLVAAKLWIDHLEWKLTLSGLHHDDNEVYMCDLPRPLKALLPDYVALEHRFQTVFEKKWDIDFSDPRIKIADMWSYVKEEEMAELFSIDEGQYVDNMIFKISPLPWDHAYSYIHFACNNIKEGKNIQEFVEALSALCPKIVEHFDHATKVRTFLDAHKIVSDSPISR